MDKATSHARIADPDTLRLEQIVSDLRKAWGLSEADVLLTLANLIDSGALPPFGACVRYPLMVDVDGSGLRPATAAQYSVSELRSMVERGAITAANAAAQRRTQELHRGKAASLRFHWPAPPAPLSARFRELAAAGARLRDARPLVCDACEPHQDITLDALSVDRVGIITAIEGHKRTVPAHWISRMQGDGAAVGRPRDMLLTRKAVILLFPEAGTATWWRMQFARDEGLQACEQQPRRGKGARYSRAKIELWLVEEGWYTDAQLLSKRDPNTAPASVPRSTPIRRIRGSAGSGSA